MELNQLSFHPFFTFGIRALVVGFSIGGGFKAKVGRRPRVGAHLAVKVVYTGINTVKYVTRYYEN